MASRRAIVPAVAAVAVVAAATGARTPSPRGRVVKHAALLDPRGWPAATAALTPLAPMANSAPLRVYVDAGHGASGNAGNTSCFCVAEQDFALRAATELARRLRATFAVRVSRDGGALVDYRDRVAAAAAWGADAIVSLHSDVRGVAERWAPRPGTDCPVSYAAPGFAVLFSDEGGGARAEERRSLARAVSRRLRQTGLLPYDGAAYGTMYERDEEPGAFVDRHPGAQRIFLLREPTMPSVIVETHHALDPREAARWDEPATLDAFASAIAAALIDAVRPPIAVRAAQGASAAARP